MLPHAASQTPWRGLAGERTRELAARGGTNHQETDGQLYSPAHPDLKKAKAPPGHDLQATCFPARGALPDAGGSALHTEEWVSLRGATDPRHVPCGAVLAAGEAPGSAARAGAGAARWEPGGSAGPPHLGAICVSLEPDRRLQAVRNRRCEGPDTCPANERRRKAGLSLRSQIKSGGGRAFLFILQRSEVYSTAAGLR